MQSGLIPSGIPTQLTKTWSTLKLKPLQQEKKGNLLHLSHVAQKAVRQTFSSARVKMYINSLLVTDREEVNKLLEFVHWEDQLH